MFELSISGNISAAHFLRGYEGKCKNLHGHNWKVEVFVCSDQLDGIGIVADFGILKNKLNDVLSQMDHVCLNDLDDFKDTNPTSENIAKVIYNNFAQVVSPLKVEKVRVWESENSSVTFSQ